MTGLSETLRALRKREDLTQEELAVKMGVHRNTVYRMEAFSWVAMKHLESAANAFGTTAYKILRHVKNAQEFVHANDNTKTT